MKINQYLRLLLLLLLLSNINACGMFSENYSKPEIAMPKHWSNDKILANTNESGFAVASLKWWQNFQDKQLDNLIADVIANNNDINKATVNIQTARIGLQAVEANWVPNIGVTAGDIAGNLPLLLNNQTASFSGVSVDYTLNILKIIREQKLAKLNIQLQSAVLNGIRLSIISQTVTTYYDLIAAREQLQISQTEIADLKLLQKHLQQQLQQGLISQLELTSNQEQISDLEGKLPAIRTNITNLENVIQVLLNHNPDEYSTQTTLVNVDTSNVLPHNIPATVLEQRPDIMIAEYNLKIAASKIGIAYANLFPQINLMAPFGVENMGNLNGTGFSTSSYWLVFIQANLPLLDLATYDNIDQSKSAYMAQRYAYIQTVHSAFSDVDNGLSWQKNAALSLDKITVEKATANRAYQLALARYKFGAISSADTVFYKLRLDNANALYYQAKLAQIQSLINFYKVLGGGYLAQDHIAVTTSSRSAS